MDRGLYPHTRFILQLRARLQRAARDGMPDPHVNIRAIDVIDIIPRLWREECFSIQEWFCRTARGLGLDVSYDLVTEGYIACIAGLCGPNAEGGLDRRKVV